MNAVSQMEISMRHMQKTACYYHLPGLFEFYELYRIFPPLLGTSGIFLRLVWHRLHLWSTAECIWGGGRYTWITMQEKCKRCYREYDISARLTFSNSLLREEHLSDRKCNELCTLFAENATWAVVRSELLLQCLKSHYPELYPVSSTTKVLTDLEALKRGRQRRFSLCCTGFPPEQGLWEIIMLESRK